MRRHASVGRPYRRWSLENLMRPPRDNPRLFIFVFRMTHLFELMGQHKDSSWRLNFKVISPQIGELLEFTGVFLSVRRMRVCNSAIHHDARVA
ncbi:unnamed protein product [Nippostrongylus brasiliensis]|uniref:DUF4158 domain-containing protein n=1 Tax=Nippostrongylus brasiliensis TaxID=27835 RepID=A0A0N4XVC4_NIPBR|nr:hypothetical protein Q1695_003052 [Nippostrongylus brasiliensis]VDL70324.1 unnamed protein product [Nippostrongylus brasiliensis]